MIHDPSRLASVLHALNLSAALSFASAALAGAEPSPSPREIIPLDNGWRFHLGDDPAARRPDFDDTSWRTLDVPHDWSIEGPVNPPPEGEGNGGYFSHGIGWYRKSFTLPDLAGKQVVIEFDAAAIEYIRTRRVHSTQRLTMAPGGKARLSMTIGELTPVVSWVLEWGPRARVIEPPELVQRVASQLREAVRLYDTVPGSPKKPKRPRAER